MNAPKMGLRPLLAVSLGLLLVVGCKKKDEPAVPDAAPVVVVIPDAGVLILDSADDAGLDAGVDAALPIHHGAAGNTNTARIKQCCNAIRAEAKTLGSSPEANVMNGAAIQCDAVAVQAGAAGTAPELAAIRTLLHGKSIPAVCQ